MKVTAVDIRHALGEIERDKQIKILYACEAGSRAWGFESNDSDYDVRFIYVKPVEWYLTISERPRDVIECVNEEQDLDIVGWELRKTLRLLKKSNPNLLEWMGSPIVYREDPDFIMELNGVSKDFYATRPLIHHYLHMARGNIREYLKSDTEVWLKKYLYVIRPLMACNWIELFDSMPPVNFEELYMMVLGSIDAKHIPIGMIQDLDDLLLRKKAGDELSYGPIVPSIHQFIQKEVKRLTIEEKNGGKNWPHTPLAEKNDRLNSLLRKMLNINKNF